jgi:hypothetical protein
MLKQIGIKTKFVLILGFLLMCIGVAAQPVAFNVTGSGSYCQGSAGLPVGLDGSTVGVTYTLIKDGISQTPVVGGTGDAISFGDQTSGTYTISGTDINGTTQMTGSAVISEKSLPVVSFISQPGANACIGVNVTYTTQALMTNYIWSFSGLPSDYVVISGGTATSNSVTINYLTTGIRTVTINYTNSESCSAVLATSSTSTTVNPPPSTSAIYHQ